MLKLIRMDIGAKNSSSGICFRLHDEFRNKRIVNVIMIQNDTEA